MSTLAGPPLAGTSLAGKRCANHPGREAAVRCPGCSGFFCRECVTEHENRMMCAPCVAKKNIAHAAAKSGGFVWTVLSAGGFLIAWLVFYYAGVGLASLPSSFFGGER
jgi:hypothetical protein